MRSFGWEIITLLQQSVYGFEVSSLYAAQIKDKCGCSKHPNYNMGEDKNRVTKYLQVKRYIRRDLKLFVWYHVGTTPFLADWRIISGQFYFVQTSEEPFYFVTKESRIYAGFGV